MIPGIELNDHFGVHDIATAATATARTRQRVEEGDDRHRSLPPSDRRLFEIARSCVGFYPHIDDGISLYGVEVAHADARREGHAAGGCSPDAEGGEFVWLDNDAEVAVVQKVNCGVYAYFDSIVEGAAHKTNPVTGTNTRYTLQMFLK